MKAFAIANTDAPPDEGFYGRIERLAGAGVDFILLRDKGLDDAARFRNAERCRGLVRSPSKLLVHARADLAVATGADGIHLPSAALPADVVRKIAPGLIVGRSCHSVVECAAAAREGLAYALLGPVFPPRSKVDSGRVSLGDLARAATLEIDVYALGGISLVSLDRLKAIPIAGVAAITFFMDDEPIEAIMEAVRNA
ncbi:MAG TPA: thiamine phosphate synthase [Thermoanaerobaculia bacterium]|nr:thiamine phosphate synthase [Thermoanaerobaculia bacterium]